jgi:hypothetical protein
MLGSVQFSPFICLHLTFTTTVGPKLHLELGLLLSHWVTKTLEGLRSLRHFAHSKQDVAICNSVLDNILPMEQHFRGLAQVKPFSSSTWDW